MARYANRDWSLPESGLNTWEQVNVALLMDIRDQLRSINARLSCYRIPRALDAVTRLDKRMARRHPLRAKKNVRGQ